jgi:hypothetical protein
MTFSVKNATQNIVGFGNEGSHHSLLLDGLWHKTMQP